MRKSPFPFVNPRLETVEKNNEVRGVLRSQGDDGSIVRQVLHYLYPQYLPVRNREQIIRQLQEFGFVVTSSARDQGLIAEENREVASDDFDQMTEALDRMMRDFGWEYDGWECVVAKN